MLRLRSIGRSSRRAFSRYFHALARALEPAGAALVSLGRGGARIGRPIVRFFRRLVRPLRGLLGDLVGPMPTLLAGAGVFLVVAGLFNYFAPAGQPDASPTFEVASGSPSLPSSPPPVTPSGSATPSPGTSGEITRAIATRVVIPALNIDLPIVASPLNEQFPLCDTAEYLSWRYGRGLHRRQPGPPLRDHEGDPTRAQLKGRTGPAAGRNDGPAVAADFRGACQHIEQAPGPGHAHRPGHRRQPGRRAPGSHRSRLPGRAALHSSQPGRLPPLIGLRPARGARSSRSCAGPRPPFRRGGRTRP